MKLHFKTGLKRCPECKSKLVICKTYRRTVKSSGYGIFDAVVHTKKCHVHGLFGPEQLSNIVSPHCTYANDIMVDAGIDRFIKGYSCSEISMQLGNGISERHVRNISNMAGEIIMQIHDENVTKLKDAMNSYILQIDGTTDSEFAMVIVVRDAISGFTLYAEKCHSESFESVKDILLKVKKKFGIPSGAISDMRAGILEALEHVFPGIPVRICLMHFLRDLGKDLLSDMHTDLGIMINKIGIKSPLKSILRSIPAYNQSTLSEIEQGFCTDRKSMEAMSVRKILESIFSTGSSGYGFPFSLSHLNFYLSCKEAEKKLNNLLSRITGEDSIKLLNTAIKEITRITKNNRIVKTVKKLSGINMLFQKIRNAFNMPDKGNLSADMEDDDSIQEKCNIVIGEMEIYLHTNIPAHMFTAAKHIITRYHERKAMLFANNPEHTIPRTNNNMEQFFRKLRRNVRKRCGNIATGNILAQSGVSLAIFQNMDNPEYVKIVFGDKDIPSVFAKYRKPFKKPGMTKDKIIKLVDTGTDMMLADSLSDTPYNDKMMDK
ncbi:MAG: transposase, partial [Candidatus Thermoplasmatota archaeon]|nr:transposase [Candidatus Thermoplasmatota archaeon]